MTREEAIKEIKKAIPYMWKETKEAIGVLVPEFTESEDERIKKIITDSVFFQYGAGVEYKDVLDYLDKLEKQKDQKPRDYRKLYEEVVNSEWFKKSYVGKSLGEERPTNSEIPKESKPEWSKNDTAFLNEITDFFENKTVRLQHDLDMYAHWLKSLPKRFNLEPKPEWTEEDEVYLEDALWCVDKAEKSCKDEEDKGACWSARRWLKSLPERFETKEDKK